MFSSRYELTVFPRIAGSFSQQNSKRKKRNKFLTRELKGGIFVRHIFFYVKRLRVRVKTLGGLLTQECSFVEMYLWRNVGKTNSSIGKKWGRNILTEDYLITVLSMKIAI